MIFDLNGILPLTTLPYLYVMPKAKTTKQNLREEF